MPTSSALHNLQSTGHRGKFGHEFMEFEFRPDGRLRYANNSNYKNDTIIRKELRVSRAVLAEVRRIIDASEIMKEDDAEWPEPDSAGRQELEIVAGGEHVSFTCAKIGALSEITSSKDPDGLRAMYFLVQDLRKSRRGQGYKVVWLVYFCEKEPPPPPHLLTSVNPNPFQVASCFLLSACTFASNRSLDEHELSQAPQSAL